MSDLIDRQAALNALDKVAEMFPYRIPGKAKTYRQYNEAWSDAIDAAENALEALPFAQPGWIPVTERLPDKEGSYLCTVQSYVGKTTYLRIADFHPDIYVEYDIEEHKPGFIDYDSEYGFYEVTKVLAWMPLPTPYRPEGGQE